MMRKPLNTPNYQSMLINIAYIYAQIFNKLNKSIASYIRIIIFLRFCRYLIVKQGALSVVKTWSMVLL